LLGTAPPSYLRSQLMPLFGGYIEALHLDGHWAFFAPDPTAGRLLRYRVEQASGASSEQPFTEALRRGDANYLRFTTLAGNLDGTSPALAHSVAQALCRRHAALAPRQIRFVALLQQRITPEQVEDGLHALDPSLLERVDLGSVPCDT
jgi:Fe-S-cluster formation regulator IscX/YfhJ